MEQAERNKTGQHTIGYSPRRQKPNPSGSRYRRLARLLDLHHVPTLEKRLRQGDLVQRFWIHPPESGLRAFAARHVTSRLGLPQKAQSGDGTLVVHYLLTSHLLHHIRYLESPPGLEGPVLMIDQHLGECGKVVQFLEQLAFVDRFVCGLSFGSRAL